MTLASKTRLGKRRLEMQELRKEKQTTTSKKHDKNCLDKGYSQEMEELRGKFKDLQERHDKVMNENTKHVDKIKQLESKVKTLESEMEMYESQPKMARTTTGELILFCNECEFPADDIYDLEQHMYEFHSEDEGNDK